MGCGFSSTSAGNETRSIVPRNGDSPCGQLLRGSEASHPGRGEQRQITTAPPPVVRNRRRPSNPPFQIGGEHQQQQEGGDSTTSTEQPFGGTGGPFFVEETRLHRGIGLGGVGILTADEQQPDEGEEQHEHCDEDGDGLGDTELEGIVMACASHSTPTAECGGRSNGGGSSSQQNKSLSSGSYHSSASFGTPGQFGANGNPLFPLASSGHSGGETHRSFSTRTLAVLGAFGSSGQQSLGSAVLDLTGSSNSAPLTHESSGCGGSGSGGRGGGGGSSSHTPGTQQSSRSYPLFPSAGPSLGGVETAVGSLMTEPTSPDWWKEYLSVEGRVIANMDDEDECSGGHHSSNGSGGGRGGHMFVPPPHAPLGQEATTTIPSSSHPDQSNNKQHQPAIGAFQEELQPLSKGGEGDQREVEVEEEGFDINELHFAPPSAALLARISEWKAQTSY